MAKHISIIDYGIGNILNIKRAFEYCGAQVSIISNPIALKRADRIVLPGVGAFGNAMQEIRQQKFFEPIRNYAITNRPLLGICLGMQLLMSESHEFGSHVGLNLIPGQVNPLPNTNSAKEYTNKIPNIGWHELFVPKRIDTWQHTILDGLEKSNANAYFVHSFYTKPTHDSHVLAEAKFNDSVFPAMIQKNNVMGCQFHPEKSGPQGLQILKNFLDI